MPFDMESALDLYELLQDRALFYITVYFLNTTMSVFSLSPKRSKSFIIP